MKLLCYSYMDLEKGLPASSTVHVLLTAPANVSRVVCTLAEKAAWVSGYTLSVPGASTRVNATQANAH